MRCFYIISNFIQYGFRIIIGSNKSFKFSRVLGNDALINEAGVIFIYLLFKICNILTGCYRFEPW